MTQAITTTGYSILPAPAEWKTMLEMAEVLVRGQLLPDSIRTPQAAITIMLKGRELGIPPMQAFASIHVIKGKPTLSAELMAALVHREGHYLKVLESTDKKCVVEIRRRGHEKSYIQPFSMEDATKAGVTSNDTWRKYPAAMLRARAISAACRVECPDVIAGMYTPEELGANISIAEDGQEIITVELEKPTPILSTVKEEWAASEVAQKLAEKYFAATSEEKFTAVNEEAKKAGLDKPNRLWLNDQRKLALEAYNAVLRAEQQAS